MNNMDYEKILADFNQRYGYVEINIAIIEKFVKECKSANIDLLYDWCLSKGIHEGVTE